MRRAYTAILYLLTPLVFLRLLWRGLRAPAYWRRWSERLGYYPSPPARAALWIHAVSVGEVLAALPLIRELRARHPESPIVLTTTTPTGSAQVGAQLGDAVHHAYLPYDLPGPVARFLRRVRPRIAIVMETEIWPNLFHACRRARIPIVIANARLSARAARRYGMIRGLIGAALRDVATLAVQTEEEARRFVALGAAAQQVQVTGSIKFDLALPPTLVEQGAALRRAWGAAGRPVWIAASTHEGEDEAVLAAHAAVRRTLPDALLLLVPRHPERFERVAELCARLGFATARRSSGQACEARTAVFLGDSMGELTLFYAAADCAFVGGSLVPTGGHNVLEPAALRLPVVFGPHMFNFTQISRLLLEAQAAAQVADPGELADAVLRLLEDRAARAAAGARGHEVVERNRGALARLVAIIEVQLAPGGGG